MDAIALYDQTTLECSRLITQRYSTSFTLGIKTLDRKLHLPIYAIYGFVRYADEIVDTFHNQDKQALLERFKKDTYESIKAGISLNPVLHAFQLIVNKYKIDLDLIEAFLHSMEMDLDFKSYNDSKYHEYIYGSAEVVGLMCLKVFCEGDVAMYEKLKEPACKLGAAFQKVNFLRDIKSDFEERGRVYFPGVDFNQFNQSVKKRIEDDIQKDFNDSLIGIEQLPKSAKLGVKVAYLYYQKLFDKIKGLPAETITQTRIRIPNSQKISLLVGTYFESKLGLT
ncbi:MAG: phytoene/squalene synthase family protein [Algoriphagus sp.]|jgi:phytoene/squalene synthetase|uniref:phytoene/squalene synthase family protein n=1 Tax=Algoriphagus sp. TaxID=1872435 RepID=UPI0027171FD8|nr:phytoene/squalene synthase family protein [Algoriphagus sp.]MDO8968954.1 phytoene/squalene synthase family protein [Algoriphagus sp.]MDP2041332.1 phytoene/squalene synthase family protein [Algoriphagus sp.]MDP3202108.1 phytoene/squalene synthase family protein [Algoriphagus sp.]MDP3470892.1 phytoene/squalene synthase family protein [Algoriphagus sp.]